MYKRQRYVKKHRRRDLIDRYAENKYEITFN